MKLMKPILTAGAAVAMLCACGGKKTVSYEDFKKKIDGLTNTNVFYDEVKVTGTELTETISVTFKWNSAQNKYDPDPSCKYSTTLISYINDYNGKLILRKIPQPTNTTFTEAPYGAEYEMSPAQGITAKYSFTFNDDFALSSYKLTSNSQTVEDLHFENSGAKHNI